MSDAVSVDPRRARMQAAAQPAQPAETQETPAAGSETATDPAQAPPPVPEAAAAVAAVEEVVSSDPTPAPSADTAATAAPNAAEATQNPTEVASVAEAATPQSSELDAAIAATLAMDSEPAAVQPGEPVPATEGAHQLVGSGGTADPERVSRDETGTPTLYSASASAGDIPGAVATPPLATAAVNGHREESNEAQTQTHAAPAQGRAAATATSSLSRVAQLTARIEKDPLDCQAQLALLHDAESKGDLERTREVYERFLSAFPDAVSFLTSAPCALPSLPKAGSHSRDTVQRHPTQWPRERRFFETRLTLERAAAVGRTMDQLLQPRTRPQSL